MVVVDVGINRIRDLIDSDMYRGQVGSGATAASTSDTSLVTPHTGSEKTLTTQTASKQLTVDYVLPATDLNGSTLQEVGYFINSASSTLLSRHVYTSIAKDSIEEIQFTVIYKFENPVS